MKLVSMLRPELIHINEKVKTKEEVIRFMVDRFYKIHKIPLKKEDVLQALFDREALGGTVFPSGLAVPHARFNDFNDILIGICIPEEPIETDGEKVRLFLMVITSHTSSNVYLQTLSQFVKISQDKAFFKSLTECEQTSRFLNLLGDIKIKKEITVEDIMDKEPCTVTPETSLKELADIFYKNDIKYAPVVNRKNEFIGEVSIGDLIKVGIPDYAFMVGNLKFLSALEPFEKLLLNEESILVGEIMRKPLLSLKPTTSVIESALEMTQGKRSHLPVIDNGKIAGVLNITDILNKVIRG
jgi:PTS system nitrogen regulatory IIA component